MLPSSITIICLLAENHRGFSVAQRIPSLLVSVFVKTKKMTERRTKLVHMSKVVAFCLCCFDVILAHGIIDDWLNNSVSQQGVPRGDLECFEQAVVPAFKSFRHGFWLPARATPSSRHGDVLGAAKCTSATCNEEESRLIRLMAIVFEASVVETRSCALKINFIAMEALETLILLILDDESRRRKLDYADASRMLSSFRAFFCFFGK